MENFKRFCEVWEREKPVPEERYRFFEPMSCVMIFFLTPNDVDNINAFFRKMEISTLKDLYMKI